MEGKHLQMMALKFAASTNSIRQQGMITHVPLGSRFMEQCVGAMSWASNA